MDAKAIADLKARVENQSATVGLVAQEASTAKALSEEVADKNQQAETKLAAIDKTLTQASSTLKKLESVTEFTITVVAAQNDDRKAFDKLREWADDDTHPFRDRAAQARDSIINALTPPIRRVPPSFPWNEGIDPSALSLEDLRSHYLTVASRWRPSLIDYIWGREDIPKIDRLDLLMSVMLEDDRLRAVEHAGRCFICGIDQRIHPLALHSLSVWWREHREEFEGR